MLRSKHIPALAIFSIGIISLMVLFFAYRRTQLAASNTAPDFLFWMEIVKPIMQLLSLTIAGGVAAALIKMLFDAVQHHQQLAEANDQFRRQLLERFIDARYRITAERDRFLNSNGPDLELRYRSFMEIFLVEKENLSRAYHDIETGRQALTYPDALKKSILNMKIYLGKALGEYRKIKSGPLGLDEEYYLKLEFFGDFLGEGEQFKIFLSEYRMALGCIRYDLLGGRDRPGFPSRTPLSAVSADSQNKPDPRRRWPSLASSPLAVWSRRGHLKG